MRWAGVDLRNLWCFHYLSNHQATFGGEFEFLFKKERRDSPVFESISDISNPTRLHFTAVPGTKARFARDITTNLSQFNMDNLQVFGTIPYPTGNPKRQNISVFTH